MRPSSILFLFLLLSDGCIDPLAVRLPANVSRLVVDGLITDDPGPYRVNLFYSSNLQTRITEPQYESGAQVWIIDDLGQIELLGEINPGVYETDPSGIRGQPGRTYFVKIITHTGEEYRSVPQQMLPAGEIENVYAEYEKNGYLLDDLTPVDAFSVFVDVRGVADYPNLFRWRWTGTYKVKTFPEYRVALTIGGPVPDPEPCSGYIPYLNGIKQIGPCTCCICWAEESSDRSLVSENRNVGEMSFHKVLVARLPASALRFFEKYYMAVEQLSVSADVYAFWKLVEAQEKAAGSLFQPNSVRVKGNIHSVSDPDKEILGIFSVSAVTRKSSFFDRSQIPFALVPLDTIGNSCLGVLRKGTFDKPAFW